MAPVHIEHDRLSLEIDPGLGAAATDLSLRGPDGVRYPVWRRTPPGLDASAPEAFTQTACFLLAPWTNRVTAGRFSFRAKEHRLRTNWPDGTAIHGEVKDRPWRLLDRSPVSARLAYDSRDYPGLQGANFPFPFACEARYELDALRVEMSLTLTNVGKEPMPAACGWHPHFMRRLWDDRDQVLVKLGVTGRYPLHRALPTGPARDEDLSRRLRAGTPLADLELDDLFAGLDTEGDASFIEWPASGVRASLWCSREITHAQVYAPRVRRPGVAADPGGPATWFCVEPYTAATDAFNLAARGAPGTGMATLAPDQSLTARWLLRLQAP
ncbi:MAG: hypothetical protein FJ255_06385 [Phycisphaerae bacterium]|nr:hypothetical protein [Phycisphaerae bacterium]